MNRAIGVLIALLLLAVMARALDLNLKMQNAETRSAKPGEYVTLGFPVSGTGDFRFELQPPDGWDALSSSKTVTLDGERTIIFNIRVPLEALADAVATFTLRASQGDQPAGMATGVIRVLGVGGVRMRAPDEVRIRVGDPVKLEVFVMNTGNRRDTIRVVPQRSIFPVTLEPSSFSLDVGESRSVSVTVTPQQQITNGYIFLLRLRGESSLSADATTDIQVLFRFGPNNERPESSNPQLTLSLNLAAQPSLTLAGAKEADFDATFSVLPSLSGQLSDYVTGAAELGGSGAVFSIKEGLGLPSGLNLSVRGEVWDSSLRLSSTEAAWSINYTFADWRISNELSYRNLSNAQQFRINTTLTNRSEDLPLQFYFGSTTTAGAQTSGDGRTDALGATIETKLTDNLTLEAGAGLTGSSNGGSPYTFGISINQSLNLQLEAVELLQTYSSAPLSAQHNFSLFAALRDTTPFGIRGGSSLNLLLFDPVQFTWRNTVAATYSGIPGLDLAASGSYAINTTPAYSIQWTAGVQGSYGLRIPGLLFGAVNASYNHVGVIVGDIATSDTTGLGLQIDAGNAQFSLEGSFKYTSPTSLAPALETTRVGARAAYAFSSSSALFALYTYNLDVSATSAEKHELQFGWGQVWNAQISTTLSYSRTLQADFVNPNKNGDALSATLTVRDLLTDGLTLGLGWRWSGSEGSIFDGAFLSQHRFTVSLGYNLDLVFDTPGFLVSVFGGRRSGAFSGVAYRDTNFNGVRDPGEPVIPNLTIQLGRDGTAVTDSEGRFTVRAPVGKYAIEFPSGLEAGLDVLGEREVSIELNQTLNRDLAFAPVSSLEVSLFDDVNNNGLRDPNESGIPYAGIKVVGPVTKAVRVDSNGNAVVSGLVDGVYAVVPDPTQLPADYRATTQPIAVTVKTPATPAAIVIGAALPPRTIVTTFESGTLAVFASSTNPRLNAGATLQLEALTQGNVERVTATLGKTVVELTKLEASWTGGLRVPLDTPIGEQTVTITAIAKDGSTATYELMVEIMAAPPSGSAAPASGNWLEALSAKPASLLEGLWWAITGTPLAAKAVSPQRR